MAQQRYDNELNQLAELITEDDSPPAVRLPSPEGGDGPLVFAYWGFGYGGARVLYVTVDTEDMPNATIPLVIRVNNAVVHGDAIRP